MLTGIRGAQSVRLARHAAIYGTSGALGKVAALLAIPYLTRQLGPADYGLVDLASSLSALLVLLVRFSGEIPTMRLAAASNDTNERKRMYSALIVATGCISLLVALVLVPAAGAIGGFLWSSPNSSPLAIAALALVPVNALQAALASVLRMVGRPKGFALAATADLLAQVGCAVVLVGLGFGPMGVVMGYVLGGTVGMAVAAVLVRNHLARDVELPIAVKIFKEGLPFLPGVAAFYFADTFSRVIAANVMGVVAVGHLALAIRIASVMALASGAFALAWGPYGLALRPSPSARGLLGRVGVAVAAFVSMVSVGIGAFAPELTIFVGGNRFAQAALAVPALVFSAGLAAIFYLLTTAAGIALRGRWVAWSAVLGAAIQVAATAVMLPSLGVAGFAIASVIGRLASISLLWATVSDLAPIRAASIILSLGIAGTALNHVMNTQPAETLVLRALLAAAAVLLGCLALFGAAFPSSNQRRDGTSVAGGPLN